MQIYFDITDILHYADSHATLSGIQRATLATLTHLVDRHGSEQISLLARHPVTDCPVIFSSAYFTGRLEYDQEDFCRHFGLRPHLAGRLLAGAARPFRRDHIQFAASDIVFMPGATWGLRSHLEWLAARRRSNGFKLLHFIHDLIPLRTPEHVDGDLPQRFADWLAFLARNVDGFIANSKATLADLDAWLSEASIRLPTQAVPLAHQYACHKRAAAGTGPPRNATTEIGARVRNAAQHPYVLCAGTMESRKNIWLLANVWRRVHATLGEATPRLIFAGNPGWLVDDFKGFLAGTGSLLGFIAVLERPTDAELAFLYGSCLFSVFVSHKEGWGLPIGEGLWFGRPVICSNVSAMPEVGGDLADYVDPKSAASIEAAVLRLITDVEYREARASRIAAAKLRSWEDVAEDLWSALTRDRPLGHPPSANGVSGRSDAAAAPGQRWRQSKRLCISREDVVHGYRHILGREPESEDVIAQQRRNHATLSHLIETLATSAEFKSRCARAPLRVDVPPARIDVAGKPHEIERLCTHVQQTWERLGRSDAHFSVLTDPRFRSTDFADHGDEFWRSGEGDIHQLARILERHGMQQLDHKTCIDFGCGVGRLVVPLARRFRWVHGYDISAPHLAWARERAAGTSNIRLHQVHTIPVLLERADVFYSTIVLQHNPPPIIAMLIRGALQCLKPGGLAVFQVPTYATDYTFDLEAYLRTLDVGAGEMEMHCIPQSDVFRIAEEAGCYVREVREYDVTCRFGFDVSNLFVIQARQ